MRAVNCRCHVLLDVSRVSGTYTGIDWTWIIDRRCDNESSAISMERLSSATVGLMIPRHTLWCQKTEKAQE